MFLYIKSISILLTLLILMGHVNSKSYFGIGERHLKDELLLRDEVENRHTGLTEEPLIAFQYSIKKPITFIEIMSEENVRAIISLSYINSIITGTVEALSTTITPEGQNEPFSIVISIFGFNKTIPENLSEIKILRTNIYNGSLEAIPEPGEVDHMEQKNLDDKEIHEEIEISNEEDEDIDDKDEDSFEEYTFESLDHIAEVGYRQKGDQFIWETYQTSGETTNERTSHSVIFYFIDSVYITKIEFVLFDFKNNKTEEEIQNSFIINYSHFSPNTLKAEITDLKTTNLFAKMTIYGYKNLENVPETYVSYVPEKYREGSLYSFITDNPVEQLREKIAALQRDANIPEESSISLKDLRESNKDFVITSITEVPNSGNVLHLTKMQLGVLSVLSFLAIIFSGLW